LRLQAEGERLSGGDAAFVGALLRPLRFALHDARAELRAALHDARYERLLERLDGAGAALPVADATVPFERLAAKEVKRMRKHGLASCSASNAALHKQRIRVKRARDAAEVAADAGSGRAAAFVRRAEKVQDVLGEHQDAVVERQEQLMADARRRARKRWKHLERAASGVV